MQQKVVKSAKKCEENAKKVRKMRKKSAKNAKICEKVRKMRKYAKKCETRMRCENGIKIRIASHRTTTAKKNRIFALFRIAFASHYHPWLRVSRYIIILLRRHGFALNNKIRVKKKTGPNGFFRDIFGQSTRDHSSTDLPHQSQFQCHQAHIPPAFWGWNRAT
jgi:hypothetical protein